MSDKTKIEWTDATWNPITGCSVVSPGCIAGTRLRHHPTREGLTVESKAGPVWNGQVRLNETGLSEPLRWRQPRMIFVCAHGDLFAEQVPEAWIDRVFAVMALCPRHTFQVLTKRPDRMREYIASDRSNVIAQAFELAANRRGDIAGRVAEENVEARGWPLPNVWLGATVEDQRRANERIPDLLATPAPVRFISAEPLLGPIQLDGGIDPLRGSHLDWVIVGGESGPGARPMHPEWARSLRDQCATAVVPFFFKQWGAWRVLDDVESLDGVFVDGSPYGMLGDDGVLYGDVGSRLAEIRSDMPVTYVERVGKKAAGRLLDGVEHNAMPEAR